MVRHLLPMAVRLVFLLFEAALNAFFRRRHPIAPTSRPEARVRPPARRHELDRDERAVLDYLSDIM
jgi:hypothetical protein